MVKRILGLLALSIAIGAVSVYVAFFYNPQSAEQETMNESWREFAREVGELGELEPRYAFSVSRVMRFVK